MNDDRATIALTESSRQKNNTENFQRRGQRKKTRPKNSTIKPLSALSVSFWKSGGGGRSWS